MTTVNAGSFIDWEKTLTPPTDYKLIGGVVYTSSHPDAFSVNGYVNPYSNEIMVSCRNLTGSTDTCNPAAIVLFAKSSFVTSTI